jgi:Putative zinc-finger
MKCREVRMTLVALLDGEVGPSERASIDAHIAGCRCCEKELAALGKTRIYVADGFRRLASEATPSETAWTRLQARIAKERMNSAGVASLKANSRRGPALRWRIALVVSGAILLAACVTAAVPSSRSAAGNLLAIVLNWYRFTPVEAGYLPKGFDPAPVYQVGLVGVPPGAGEDSAVQHGSQKTRTEQTLYRSGDWFVLVRITSDRGEPLPEGRTTDVNGNHAVLITGLSGFVPPPEELQMGERTSASTSQRYSVTYRDANALTWTYGDTRVEVLSDLPVEEIRKVAEGLVIGKVEKTSP